MLRRIAIVLATLALAATACQTVDQDAIEAEPLACPPDAECYDPPAAPGPGGMLTITAGDLFFEQGGVRSTEDELVLETVQGDVEVTLDNQGAALHNFRIDAALAPTAEGKKVETPGGTTETGTLSLFAGEYTFYCDVPGHRAAGMEGRLIVRSPDDAEGGGEQAPGEPDDTETAETGTEA